MNLPGMKIHVLAAGTLLLLGATVAGAQSLSVLRHFGTEPGDPMWPREIGLVAEGPDGSLYSTSTNGGKNNLGMVFKMMLDGKLTVLHNFDGKSTGSLPQSGLTCRKGIDGKCDGIFYGTAYGGGKYAGGTIFRSATAVGAPEVLYNFRAGYMLDVTRPSCEKPPCPYTTQQRLDAYAGFPVSAPVQGSDGNFYGVTPFTGNYKYGMLYRISPGGGPDAFRVLCIGGALPTNPLTTDKDLINACMFNGDKGNYPVSLIAASDGNLYGVAYGGLASNPYGTIFKATLDGRVSLVYKFDLTNGSAPYSIMQGKDGNLYGTTAGGGKGYGVVYKVSTQGGPPIFVRSFNGNTEGLSPVSGLAQGLDGTLYGTTKYGGSNGRGVIYRISPTGTDFKVLDNFNLYVTGRTPLATPMLHTSSNLYERLYGLTYQGGSRDAGVFYSLCLAPNSHRNYTKDGKLYNLQHEDDKVRVETGVTWTNPVAVCPGIAAQAAVASQDGITITVKNCKQNPQVVQFVYRERVLADGTLEGGPQPLTQVTGPNTCKTSFKYCLTTNPTQPEWRTDSGAKPIPYYQNYRMYCDSEEMTTYDAPNFDGFNPQKYRLWRATFVSFVLCNGQVGRQIHWTREITSVAFGLSSSTHYNVEKPVEPDPELVKKLQCLSTKEGFDPWTPYNLSQPPVLCAAPTVPDEISGKGCPQGP